MVTAETAESSLSLAGDSFEELLNAEYPRLRRLCARLSGASGAAEDLAQETLLEAWRNRYKLAEQIDAGQEERARWLTAIARNVCLRWRRSYSRDQAHLALCLPSLSGDAESLLDLDELPVSDENLDLGLERDELALLLDRALALLPPATRSILIERYIHESSHAEIAERFGLREDALVQRLYRGKLALRRVIETHLRAEAAAYGLVTPQSPVQATRELETRIRCPLCDRAWLNKCDDPTTGQISFRCPVCSVVAAPGPSPIWQGLSSPKSILKRQLAWLSTFYWQAINQGKISCPRCGHLAHTRILSSSELAGDYRRWNRSTYASAIRCEHCQFEDINPLSHLALDVPEALQFWREHTRIFWLPEREIAYSGLPALLSGFQSASGSDRLDIVFHRETLKILGIHTTIC